MRTTRGPGIVLGVLVAGVGLAGRPASADDIKLRDGVKFSGKILDRGVEGLVIEVPRSAVETVNGHPLPPPVGAGTDAPGFTAVDVQGAAQALSKPNGQPVVLAFWATWCPHCRSDVPFLKEVFAKYHAKGLRVLAVSVDRDAGAAKKFSEDQHLEYTVIAAAAQPNASDASIPDLYEVRGIPAYYLIDAHGVIRKTKNGSIMEGNTQAEWEEAVSGLLPKS